MCSTYVEMCNGDTLIGKQVEKRLTGKPRRRWKDYIR